LVASSPITIISYLLSRFLSRPRFGLNLRRPTAAAAAATVQRDLRVEEEEDDEEEDASLARTTHSLSITVVRD
jgi:hypothetical protein